MFKSRHGFINKQTGLELVAHRLCHGLAQQPSDDVLQKRRVVRLPDAASRLRQAMNAWP